MIDDRQFFITREHPSCYQDWNKIVLVDGQVMYCQSQLNVIYLSERIVLVGYAWQADPDRKSPAEELKQLDQLKDISRSDVYSIENSWCGRYLLIVKKWIFLDASGSMGVFYSPNTISSSLNVLCNVEKREICYPPIEHRHMPDFIPGMRTPYEDIKRLIPSQVLNIENHKWETRPLLITPIINYSSYEEGIEYIKKYFVHSFQNLAKEFEGKPLWFALTGGRDSRASLAFLELAGVNYQPFTLWHEHIQSVDYKLAKKIARRIGRKHRFVKRNENAFNAERFEAYRQHSAGMAVDEDWKFYAYHQYQDLQEDNKPIVILRSSIWEICNEYYVMTMGNKAEDPYNIFPYIKKSRLLEESTLEWWKYIAEDNINKQISVPNRTFWELREGCWLSSIEQSFDMMDGITSVQTANCRLFISLLLGFPLKDREQKLHEDKIAAAICPKIANIPYDYQLQGPSLSLRIKIAIWNLLKKVIGIVKK